MGRAVIMAVLLLTIVLTVVLFPKLPAIGAAVEKWLNWWKTDFNDFLRNFRGGQNKK